jgi:hypothetical protein
VSAGAGSPASYEALVDHAERELELVANGDVAGLLALGEDWDALVAALPAPPPASAADALERATMLHERAHIDLLRMRDGVLAEIATSSRARQTADGYAGQLRRRPRVDASA